MRHHATGSSTHDRKSPRDQPAPPAGDVTAPAPIAASGESPAREPQEPRERAALPGGLSSTAHRTLDRIEHELERPGVGALTLGAALFVAAVTAGVGETVVGALGAYTMYRILRRRRTEHAGRT
jgi:hypothetical protein